MRNVPSGQVLTPQAYDKIMISEAARPRPAQRIGLDVQDVETVRAAGSYSKACATLYPQARLRLNAPMDGEQLSPPAGATGKVRRFDRFSDRLQIDVAWDAPHRSHLMVMGGDDFDLLLG